MKKLIIFNWKMAPDSLKEAKRFFNAVLDFKSYIINSEIVITPPFVYLNEFKNKKLKNLKLGAQDVFGKTPALIPEKFLRRCSKIQALNM